MKATFNFTVDIDSNNVTTTFGSDKVEDMDTTLLVSILRVFGDVSNKVKKQVAQFYGVSDTPIVMPEETTAAATIQDVQEQNDQQ